MSALRDRALVPAGVLAAGHRLGRYEVLTKLASGGMAMVYVASAQGTAGFERLFAIKVLHANLAHEEEFIGMFLDEARLAARIHHPNVVPTIDISDTIETGYFLVMEYVEGDHLGALLSTAHKLGERIPLNVVLRIGIDALLGLGAAHDLRDESGKPLLMVHRDVSPHNILVGCDGIARLTDFGVAKAEDRLTHTRDGQVKGKLAYMAPEQASSGATDSRSDLFSIGIILWECVTGRRLFRADNTAATLTKLLGEPIALPSTIDPALAPLDPVMKKALDRDPAARFQTAEEFVEALEWVAGRVGGVATRRAVTKVIKQYAGDKLARERRLIEAAQRAARGEAAAEGEPSASIPSVASDVSVWSMSRSKPSGIFSNVTAPRLFTRGRSARPAAADAPQFPPPPIGDLVDVDIEVPSSPALPDVGAPAQGRGLLLSWLIAGVVIACIGVWLALQRQRPEPSRTIQLDPAPAAPAKAEQLTPPGPAPALPLGVVEVEPAQNAAPDPVPQIAPPAEPSSATPSGSQQRTPNPVRRAARRPPKVRNGEHPAPIQHELQITPSKEQLTPPLPNPYTSDAP